MWIRRFHIIERVTSDLAVFDILDSHADVTFDQIDEKKDCAMRNLVSLPLSAAPAPGMALPTLAALEDTGFCR